MKTKLWTIQNESGWQELNTNKVLIPKEEFVDSEFKEGYDWLKIQMINRIGKPKNSKQYPIWAWYQFQDEFKKRPDLRSSGYLPSGDIGYRIEIEKSEKDILFSDFELWHIPLAYRIYIANSEEEQLEFESELMAKYGSTDFEKLPKKIKNQIEKSWLKIFDMNFDIEYYAKPYNEKQIQATFWQLNIEDVKKVDKFRAR